MKCFQSLEIDHVTLLGISKGPGRKADFDMLWRVGDSMPLALPAHSIALHFIQAIRDEAHRFAIGGHKLQRNKTTTALIFRKY